MYFYVHTDKYVCMYAYVFDIINVRVMYIKYIKSANILILFVAKGKHTLEISPEMLCVCYSAHAFFLKHMS